jgi:PspA-Associated protein
VIVRLMGEGQWRVDDGLLGRLNELDEETERAVQAGDEAALHASLEALAAAVRAGGERLDDAHLAASDLVVPPVDLTLDEGRELLHGEGLIPDLP